MANRVVPDRQGLINIGKLKENLVIEVELPAPGFAGGSYAVLLQRPREKQPYPVTARTDGGRLIWTVQTADTAIAGTGKLECRWYGDNGEVAKSQTYMVRITDGLPDPTEAPEAYAGYIAQVARNAEAAKSAASVAGAAAGRAETALKALEDGIASGDFRGEKGDPATLTWYSVTYMVSDSGTIVPSGSWLDDVPNVPKGKYLWTRTVLTFNTGSPVTSYSVSRFGIDGTGSVSSVNSQNPDNTGNVKLTAADIAGSDGQSVEAALARKQTEITSVGLLKGTGNGGVTNAVAGVDYQTPLIAGTDYQAPIIAGAGVQISGTKVSTAAAPRNWLDNSDFTNLVAQAGIGGKHGNVAYAVDRWKLTSGTVTYTAGTGLTLNGIITQVLEKAPTGGSCFVGMASGTATIALNGNTITITSSGGVIKWAALYEGTYTEANRPEYQPNGIAQERIACHRFFVRADAWRPIYGYASWDGGISLFLPTPTEMRISPTATTLKGTIYINGSSIDIDETPADVIKTTQGLQILLRTKTPENPRHNCALNLAETAAYFSADL